MLKKAIITLFLFSSVSYGVVSSGTYTIAESGGNYTTLSAAEADLASTLTGSVTFYITGSWTNPDTTAVSFAGCATASDKAVYVVTQGDARHAGAWSDTAYRRMVTSGNNLTISAINHIVIDGLQGMTTGEMILDVNATAGKQRTVKNCIFRGRNDKSTTQRGWDGYNGGASEGVYLFNNVFYGFYTQGVRIYATANSTYCIVNNTIVESGEADDAIEADNGYGAGTSVRFINNFVQDGDINIVGLPGTSILQRLNNASEDNSGDIGYRMRIGTFPDKANVDLSNVNDSTRTASGYDYVASPIPAFASVSDIIGTSWSTPPSIGSHEYVSEPPAEAAAIRRKSYCVWFE